MTKSLQYTILFSLWAVQVSHGLLLSEPTQGSEIADLDRPPEPTVTDHVPDLRYAAKRQSNDDLVVTMAPDETCGYLGQKNADFITTHIPLTGSKLSSTKTTATSSSTASSSTTNPSSSSIPASSSSSSPSSSQNNLGAIIGGAIGGFAAVSLVILAIVWFIRQSRKKKHPPPTQVTAMEQTPLSDQNGMKPDGTPVQPDWRSSTLTALSSPHSTSPQAWMDHPVSPSAQSDTSGGILSPMGQHLAYEMSGDSVPPRAQERRDSRVYEMAGDPNPPWV
ncbi:hypothetical protein FLONG3_9774 [Fusarium longipes]|uniref:Mid2 domain-containing protein n=1 Tax=Fusarium longipes TaxID=694270 RepID=A0A395RUR6_9HYPO|nr:hypothetical protein FLONG3_9774 [Fusarium longipes]